MTSGAHSHPEYVTHVELDALLAGYARIDHTHGAPPEPEPEPTPAGTWFDTSSYSSWQRTFEAAASYQQNGGELAGVRATNDDVVRNYALHVDGLHDCVIEAPEGVKFTSRSTNKNGSALRFWFCDRVTVRRLVSRGPGPDRPANDDNATGLSDSCGLKTDGCADITFEDCEARNHFCAGFWFTANDPRSGHPEAWRRSSRITCVRTLAESNQKDGHHGSHGCDHIRYLQSVSRFNADDGHSLSAEWGGNVGGLIDGARSESQARASYFTLEGLTDTTVRNIRALQDKDTAALVRCGTNSSYPGDPCTNLRVEDFDFHVRVKNYPHRIIHLTSGGGPVAGVTFQRGKIAVAERGSAAVVGVFSENGHPITRVLLKDIHVTAPDGVQFLETNVRPQITIDNCTLNGVPVMV